MINEDRPGLPVMYASAANSRDSRKGPKTEQAAQKEHGPRNFGDDESDPVAFASQAAERVAEQADLPARFQSHQLDQQGSSEPQNAGNSPGELQILEGISLFKKYLLQQRDCHRPKGAPIRPEFIEVLRHFFTPRLLARVRIVELHGERMPNPPFYARARALGFAKLPELSHQASLTFIDVIVFNEKLEDRKLFHALVHTVQFEVLGLDRYVELSVRGFAKKRSYFMVPLKAHAFALDLRFAVERAKPFSVEEEIRHWARVGLY